MSRKRPKFNILSLDGGGARGCFTASILERIEQEKPDFLDQFDLIAGKVYIYLKVIRFIKIIWLCILKSNDDDLTWARNNPDDHIL